MFFLLSKTLDLALDPLWWVLATLVPGLVLLARGTRRTLALGLCGVAIAVLTIGATPALVDRLWHGLEDDAVPSVRPDVTYDAVVLLGGMVNPLGSTKDDPAWNDNIERLITTWRLLSTNRARSVIVTGGSLGNAALGSEAELLAAQLEAWGIAHDRIVVESKALNTRENASFTRELAATHGFKTLLLVTSAYHVPRAVGCFRAAGLEVDVLPVDYRVRDPARDAHVVPRIGYLGDLGQYVRERVGTLVYRVMGYVK